MFNKKPWCDYSMKQFNIAVAVCSRSFGRNKHLRQHLDHTFSSVVYYEGQSSLQDDSLIDFLQDKSVAILGLEKITPRILDACPDLKVICKMGTGIDKIDLEELEKREILFFNTPGFNKHAVAELVLTHALILVRNIKVNLDNVANRQWKQSLGGELYGKRLGLLGFGAIGQEVARISSALGCSICAYDINQSLIDQSQYVEYVSKSELFSQSDIISIHIPLLDSTRNTVNEALINLMKSGSIIINTSRGEVLDQTALLKRLNTGDISAGLDVLHSEPQVDFGLSQLSNILITPHIGGSTNEAVRQNGMSIINFLKSKISDANTITM